MNPQKSNQDSAYVCMDLGDSFSIGVKQLDDLVSDTTPIGVFFLDNNFVLRKFNRRYTDFIKNYSQYTPDRALGLSYFKLLKGSRDQVGPMFSTIRNTGRGKVEYNFNLRIGEVNQIQSTYWNASLIPVLNVELDVEGIVIVAQDITEERLAHKALEQKNQLIEQTVFKNEELKTALQRILSFNSEIKQQPEEAVLSKVRRLILPYVEKLESELQTPAQMKYLNIIKSNLNILAAPTYSQQNPGYSDLTPKETEIINLVDQGKATKEIADLQNISKASVDTHRHNIRRKLGLNGKKVRLSAHLVSQRQFHY